MRRHAIVAPLLSILVMSSVTSREAAAAPASNAPVARRYIAILKDGITACPTLTDWTSSELFGLKYDPKATRGYRALQRFCLYTGTGAGGELSRQSSLSFMRVDPDYDVLVPQGSLAKDPEVREALNQIYRTMLDLGPIGSAKTQQLYTSKVRGRVAQVAVIDTASSAKDPIDHGTHGWAMAEIINEVRCPAREAKCRAHLSFYNAFPWISTTAALSYSSSEPLGSLGSLSREIYRAVSHWRTAHPDGTTGAPLILNLSLAWDPGAGNKSPAWAPDDRKLPPWDIPPNQGDEALRLNDRWPATVQAVHAALVYASCFDVLTIAAAGNSTRGAEVQTGALAPAKWEKLLAPTPKTCRELFGAIEVDRARRPGNSDISVERSPLVYAVRGRMTGIGNALPNSRKGSTSLQISPASHVVAGAGRSRTDPWSGSSVAAATYSGLAATLWSYDPRLTPHQVMALIYDTGEKSTLLYPGKPIRFNPVLLQGGTVETPTGEVRATSPNPFGAFEALCPTGCGYGNPYTEAQAPALDEHRLYLPLTQVLPDKIATTGSLEAPGPDLAQTPKVDNRTHFFPVDTTPPLAEAADAKPWTRPQPQTPICPTCPVTGTTLTLSLTNVPDELKEGDKVILENPVLEFNLGDTQGFFAVSLGKIEVPPAGLRVSLDRYTIKVDGVEKGLGTAILESQVRAGTLTIFLEDSATGEVRTNVSVVPVLP